MNIQELQQILDNVEKTCGKETKVGHLVWRLETTPEEKEKRDTPIHKLYN